MAWTAFELPKLPDGLSAASNGLNTISGAVGTLMGMLKTAVEILAALDVSGLNPAQLIIKAAVEAIQQAIKSLLEDSGVYVLLVPVRRQVVISPLVESALAAVGLPGLPPGQISPTVAKMTAVDAGTALSSFLFNSSSADGGNAGFLRTVVESIDDPGDAGRPQFGENDAVAGFYILAGAADFSKLLGLTSTLNALFATKRSGSSLDVPDLPVPQNLRVKAVPGPDGKVTALLEWDTQLPLVKVPTLGDTVVQVTEFCVIRSKTPSLLSRFTVQEVFGSGNLSVGKKIGVGDDEIEVIAVEEYVGTGLRSNYYDTSELEAGKPYYYTVGYNMSVGSAIDIAQGSAQDVGFRRLSNAAKLYYTGRAERSGAGTAPDWIRTPSVVDLLPDVSGLIRQLLAFLEQMGGTTSGFGDMLRGYAKFLEQEIENFQGLVDAVAGQIDKLTALTSVPTDVGVYFKPFGGVGGVEYMIRDLASALSDSTDDGRPPFDSGDEFVTGIVVLAGAPTEAGLVGVKTMIDTLFGGASADASPLATAVSVISTAVVEAEQQVFTDAFTPGGTPAADSAPLVGADDDGEKDLNCPLPVTSNPTLGDDFKPKE